MSNDPEKQLALFRPVGIEELRLINAAEMKSFPPRLPEQPIFYPVLHREYAVQIARDWNATPHSLGIVLGFAIDADYAAKFPIQTVGGSIHQELWVPAEELAEFNRHILGRIEILELIRGEHCTIDLVASLKIPKN